MINLDWFLPIFSKILLMWIKIDSKMILYTGCSDKDYVFFQRMRIYPVDKRDRMVERKKKRLTYREGDSLR